MNAISHYLVSPNTRCHIISPQGSNELTGRPYPATNGADKLPALIYRRQFMEREVCAAGHSPEWGRLVPTRAESGDVEKPGWGWIQQALTAGQRAAPGRVVVMDISSSQATLWQCRGQMWCWVSYGTGITLSLIWTGGSLLNCLYN